MRSRTLLAAALLYSLTGCGGSSDKLDVYPTGGMLSLDGEPFGPISLRLIPVGEGGHSVVGKADEFGTTTFTTYEIGDGAPAGDYVAVVGLDMAAPPKPFPSVYQNEEKSPLRVTVTESESNVLDLAMDSSVGGPIYKGPSFNRGPDLGAAYQSDAFSAGASPEGGK